jgi:signal peptidase I
MSESEKSRLIDVRLTMYKTIKLLALILLISLIVKFAFCDTLLIKTDQMAPAVQNGDRVLLSKTRYKVPFKLLFYPQYNNIVIFKHPHFEGKTSCLRIAGKPGDVVSVQNGVFLIEGKPDLTISTERQDDEMLPEEYSPRDNLQSFYIPQKGDTLLLDTFDIRNIIFVYSMIKQEKPVNHYSLKPLLYLNDSLNNDYLINDFSLYSGRFNDIPDTLYTDWLFWKHLQAYFDLFLEYDKATITFSIMHHQKKVSEYIVKQRFYFLLSDRWDEGYDSRYFGPVCASAMTGRVTGVIWSFSPEKSFFKAFRARRVCKIIK